MTTFHIFKSGGGLTSSETKLFTVPNGYFARINNLQLYMREVTAVPDENDEIYVTVQSTSGSTRVAGIYGNNLAFVTEVFHSIMVNSGEIVTAKWSISHANNVYLGYTCNYSLYGPEDKIKCDIFSFLGGKCYGS